MGPARYTDLWCQWGGGNTRDEAMGNALSIGWVTTHMACTTSASPRCPAQQLKGKTLVAQHKQKCKLALLLLILIVLKLGSHRLTPNCADSTVEFVTKFV